jgi:4-hydroxy-tetrahydrodipicolinate synthase
MGFIETGSAGSSHPPGVLAPLTTPFDAGGAIDERAFVAEIEWLLVQDVDGVVVGGSTGEGYTLSLDELARLVELTVATVGDRRPVVASIIADSTRAVTAGAERLSRFPLAALQVTPPHYIFPPDDDGFVAFYRAAAAASAAPVVVYNVLPWMQLGPALLARIIESCPGVVAVKHSAKDVDAYRAVIAAIGAPRVYAAIDDRLGDCYAIGAVGSIAAINAAAPAANVRLWRAVRDRDHAEADRIGRFLADLWAVLTGNQLPARVKAAQALQGAPLSRVRAPMVDADADTRRAIEAVLASAPDIVSLTSTAAR